MMDQNLADSLLTKAHLIRDQLDSMESEIGYAARHAKKPPLVGPSPQEENFLDMVNDLASHGGAYLNNEQQEALRTYYREKEGAFENGVFSLGVDGGYIKLNGLYLHDDGEWATFNPEDRGNGLSEESRTLDQRRAEAAEADQTMPEARPPERI